MCMCIRGLMMMMNVGITLVSMARRLNITGRGGGHICDSGPNLKGKHLL